jgi:GH25 family lysozyme M1 (1,4-beta-N-acetylmuramidase)
MKKIIDISKWQGDIDFCRLKQDVELVIIRVQYGSSTVDSKYKEYVQGCKDNGIPFAHYAYARFINIEDAKVEAKDFLARADKDANFLVVDVEEVTTNNPSELADATQAFIDYIKANDSRPVGLYTGEYFYAPHNLDKVDADFLWIAKYGVNDGQPHTKPNIACDLWQFSSTAKVLGINGNVDINILNGDKPLEYFVPQLKPAPEPPKPAPAPEPAPSKPSVPDTYKIKSGDTFSEIANRFGLNVSDLMKLNPVDPTKLQIGQIIRLKPAPKPPVPSYVGKRVECKVEQLRFYAKPSWSDKDVAGIVKDGEGFTIVSKVDVNGSPQYKVKNSRGAVYYITANEKYVVVK